MSENKWDAYWAKRAMATHARVQNGVVTITRNNTRLQIECPHDPLFVILAQGADAMWRHKTRAWSFPEGQWMAALNAVVQCFGRDRLGEDWLHYMDTENAKHDAQ